MRSNWGKNFNVGGSRGKTMSRDIPMIMPMPVKLVVVGPMEGDEVALLRLVLGTHGGTVEGHREWTEILFPVGTTRIIRNEEAEMVFPDGYRIRERFQLGRWNQVALPEEDLPEAWRGMVPTFVGQRTTGTAYERRDD